MIARHIKNVEVVNCGSIAQEIKIYMALLYPGEECMKDDISQVFGPIYLQYTVHRQPILVICPLPESQ